MPDAMRPPLLRIHTDELVVDSFAGGGGASLGIEWALGRSPDIAINHDAEAIAMHKANHPSTKHRIENVWSVNPKNIVKGGKRIALAWFSPDCAHFSKARGGKPFRDRNPARRRRGLAWVVIRWAKLPRPSKPRVIILENVEEFQDWGPLLADGTPCPLRRGFTFRRWCKQLENCGYKVESRELRACDYGAPTTRKRLFIIARSDGLPIVWPRPTHGPGRLPFRTAAECITWALPCPSIFGRKRPLAENTQKRIARGLRRYVIEAPEPFIVPVAHAGDARTHSIHDPMPTVTGAHRGEHALVAPHLTRYYSDIRGDKSVEEPLPTITSSDHHALVAAYLARLGQKGGNGKYTNDALDPLTTVTTKAEHLLIEPYLVRTAHGEEDSTGKKRGRGEHDITDPLPTQLGSNDFALACATMIHRGNGEREGQAPRTYDVNKPHPTVVAGGVKTGLVTAFLARHNGQTITKGAQVRMCGNSVCPPLAQALVTAQFAEVAQEAQEASGG